jgi:hypothetical protein
MSQANTSNAAETRAADPSATWGLPAVILVTLVFAALHIWAGAHPPR